VALGYGVWIAILLIGFVIRGKCLLAPRYFWETIKTTGRTPV